MTKPYSKSRTEEVDANVDAELLDIINQNDDFESQQRKIERIAKSLPEVTVARRLYGMLFPTVESSSRRAG